MKNTIEKTVTVHGTGLSIEFRDSDGGIIVECIPFPSSGELTQKVFIPGEMVNDFIEVLNTFKKGKKLR